jgi:Tol biopolymer transport system component
MRAFRLFCMLLLVACWTAPTKAQYFGRNKVQYERFNWRVLRTPHFEIYYYPEAEVAVRDAARMAERWYQRHSRTFLHEFGERKPIIFYADDADFHQTNAISGEIGEGTGGVTESIKERVIMPFTGLYRENDHVLGHELVHSFQYDIALNRSDSLSRFNLALLPLWLVEGMAEYLSLGRNDPHTAMWLRDAALRDDLPTIQQLTRSYRYFPYRYGQAYLAYIGGKYGDQAVTNLYKLGGIVGVDTAISITLGITPDSLSKEWIQVVKNTYLPLLQGRTPPSQAGRKVLAPDLDAGEINLAPALSPDGRYVAFLSERDLFTIDLFLADAETGQVLRRLSSSAGNPHFDAIRFINSSGSWSPDGQRFAFIIFARGGNEIAIWNLRTNKLERRIGIEQVGAIHNLAWSPDGRRIAFSGLSGGISDLYLLDLETTQVRKLTDDRYADLQPAWSPDGRTLAFVSDRGPDGTDFDILKFGQERLVLLDLETGQLRPLRPFRNGQQINPQFSPDGRNLYFISDHDGFKDIYRMELATGAVYRITKLQTGVSGITSLSPAMSVAAQNGRMAFSVFTNNQYLVFSLEPDQLQGEPVEPEPEAGLASAGILPPLQSPSQGLVSSYLNDPLTGLPDELALRPQPYRRRLQLDYVAPPTFGASIGGPFGTMVAGGVGFFFSDMLGDQQLAVVAQANGTFKDIGGQLIYINQGRRLNYGGVLSHIPLLYGYAYLDPVCLDPATGLQVPCYVQLLQRIYIDEAGAIGYYPLNTTQRLELMLGFQRYGFDYDAEIYYLYGAGYRRATQDLPAPKPIYFFQAATAFVGDFSFFGFTSPVRGARYRLQVAPLIGTERFVQVILDGRKYFFFRPLTFATRLTHVGNYGANPRSPNELSFAQEYLGYGSTLTFVRGYSFYSLEPNERCTPDPQTGYCAEVSRLFGTHVAVASMELRLPLFGTERFGLINFPYLPTELSFFADAGVAWSKDSLPVWKFKRVTAERVPVFSTGISTRFNVLGAMVLELFYVYPFQRPDKGWYLGAQLVPGW